MTRFRSRIAYAVVSCFIFLALGARAEAQMPSSCVAGQNIYYVDNVSGSDSNSQSQARSKSTPWAHQPYMASFSGSYSHTPGDCFVFKGGDRWVAADRPNISSGGSSTSEMDYYGTDPSWFSGSTFARPVFDIQSNASLSNVVQINASYVIWDNWEFVNASCGTSGPNQFIISFSGTQDYIYATNNYFHSFMNPKSGCGSAGWFIVAVGNFTNSGCHGMIDHNVVDGFDGNTGYPAVLGAISTCAAVTHNVFRGLCNAINTHSHVVAYNLIYDIADWNSSVPNCSALGGLHPNAMQLDTDADIHDNVIYNMAGGEAIQLTPGRDGCTSGCISWPVSHIYNNVMFSNSPTAIEFGTGGAGEHERVSGGI